MVHKRLLDDLRELRVALRSFPPNGGSGGGKDLCRMAGEGLLGNWLRLLVLSRTEVSHAVHL